MSGDFVTFEDFLDITRQSAGFPLDFPRVGRNTKILASKLKNEDIAALFLSSKMKTIAKPIAERVIEEQIEQDEILARNFTSKEQHDAVGCWSV